MQKQKKKHQKFKEYETHHVEIFLMSKNNFNPLLNSFSRQAVHGFGPASLNPNSILPLKCLFPLILYLQFYVMKPKQKTVVDTQQFIYIKLSRKASKIKIDLEYSQNSLLCSTEVVSQQVGKYVSLQVSSLIVYGHLEHCVQMVVKVCLYIQKKIIQ